MTDATTGGARMIAACTSGDEATVRELLRETPSLASEVPGGALAPLHYAVREGHACIVQLLLDHGAALDVANQLGFTPVYVTLFRNHSYTYARPRWGLFELLLARGAPYDINLACAQGDIDTVRSLLAADAGAIHFQAPCKKRPLSCAAEFARRPVVKKLACLKGNRAQGSP